MNDGSIVVDYTSLNFENKPINWWYVVGVVALGSALMLMLKKKN